MEITFTCPNCGEVTLIDETYVGQAGPCRSCDAVVTVPKIVVEPTFYVGANLGPASPPMPWLIWLGWIALLTPILFIVLLPWLGVSRETPSRVITQHGVKQIFLALQAYESEHGQLPRAFYRNEQGEITLPWRVAILPYLEEQSLFEQIATNEPWDSPHNYQAAATTVRAFDHPNAMEGRNGQTGFVAVTGPGSLFVEGQNKRLADCKLLPSQTIVLVEIPECDLHWSEPVDVDLFVEFFRAKGENPQERRFFWPDGAEAAFADGTIRRLSASELERTLQKMFSSAGAEDLRARFAALSER